MNSPKQKNNNNNNSNSKKDLRKWLDNWDEYVKARDLSKIIPLLADDIKFYSPYIFKPSNDKKYICQVFGYVVETIENFHYVGRFDIDEQNKTITAVFEGRVKSKDHKSGYLGVEGVDMFVLNDDMQIKEFKVMIRPINALMEVGKQMKSKFITEKLGFDYSLDWKIYSVAVVAISIISYFAYQYHLQ